MGIRPERVNGHIGTEIRPRLLREAAAKNIISTGGNDGVMTVTGE